MRGSFVCAYEQQLNVFGDLEKFGSDPGKDVVWELLEIILLNCCHQETW